MLRAPCADIRYIAMTNTEWQARPNLSKFESHADVQSAMKGRQMVDSVIVAVHRNADLNKTLKQDQFTVAPAADMVHLRDADGNIAVRTHDNVASLRNEWNRDLHANHQAAAKANSLEELEQLAARREAIMSALSQVRDAGGHKWFGIGREADWQASELNRWLAVQKANFYKRKGNQGKVDEWMQSAQVFVERNQAIREMDDRARAGLLPAATDLIPFSETLQKMMSSSSQFPWWRLMDRPMGRLGLGLSDELDGELQKFAQALGGTPNLRTRENVSDAVPTEIGIEHWSRAAYQREYTKFDSAMKKLYLTSVGNPNATGARAAMQMASAHLTKKPTYSEWMERVGRARIMGEDGGDPLVKQGVAMIDQLLDFKKRQIEAHPELLRSYGQRDAAMKAIREPFVMQGRPFIDMVRANLDGEQVFAGKAKIKARMDEDASRFEIVVAALRDMGEPVEGLAVRDLRNAFKYMSEPTYERWRLQLSTLVRQANKYYDIKYAPKKRSGSLEKYWHHVYRHDTIAANKQHFVDRLTQWFARNPEYTANQARQEAEETIEAILSSPTNMELQSNVRWLQLREKRVRQSIENLEKLQRPLPPEDPRAVKLFQERMDLEVYADILKLRIEENISNRGPGYPAPFMERVMTVPDKILVGDDPALSMIELNPQIVLTRYLERVAPRIEMAEKFGGDPIGQRQIDGWVDKAIAELQTKIYTGQPGRTMAQRNAEFARGLEAIKTVERDMRTLVEKVLGIYETPKDPTRADVRAIRALQGWSVLTHLGASWFSAVGDTAGIVLANGLGPTFRTIMTASRRRNWDKFRAAASDIKTIGVTAEMAIAIRGHLLADMSGAYVPHLKIERWIDRNVPRMFLFNGLGPWTDLARTFGALTQMNDTLARAERVMLGRASNEDLSELAFRGLSKKEANELAKAWHAQGRDQVDGINLLTVDRIADKRLRNKVAASLTAQVDNMVMMANPVDRPNVLANPYAKFILMYKGFAISATQRLGFAALQRKDRAVWETLIAGTALMYAANYVRSDYYRDMDVEDQIFQAVKRNPIMGIAGDVDHAIYSLTGGTFGVHAMFDNDREQPARAHLNALTGAPSSILYDAASFLSEGEIHDERLYRNLPYYGLFWLQGIHDIAQINPGEEQR